MSDLSDNGDIYLWGKLEASNTSGTSAALPAWQVYLNKSSIALDTEFQSFVAFHVEKNEVWRSLRGFSGSLYNISTSIIRTLTAFVPPITFETREEISLEILGFVVDSADDRMIVACNGVYLVCSITIPACVRTR